LAAGQIFKFCTQRAETAVNSFSHYRSAIAPEKITTHAINALWNKMRLAIDSAIARQ
jgi:hypothetical protein